MVGSNEAGVSLVTRLGISLSRIPIAIFAEMRAIGYPVAFDASADERDTRGFTSITRYSPFFRANCMLQPPSIRRARMIRIEALRSIWCSTSERVCDGVTTIDSPVCTPMGSTFSMLQMVMQVSPESRITSYSNSFHPRTLSSTKTWPMRDFLIPFSMMAFNCASFLAMPLPPPPRVYADRTIAGKPSSAASHW